MKHSRHLPFFATLFLLLPLAPLQAQVEQFTLDWYFSDEGRETLATPRLAWLDDGTLVMYDQRKPAAERTFVTVNPQNGRTRALLDRKKALESMNAVLQPGEPLEEPGWPTAFGPNGRYATYERGNDIYLLDLQRAELRKVAATPAEEGSARFSPDGSKLAFVRNNDLYVFDIATGEETRLTDDGSDTLLNGNVSWVYWEELLHRSNRGYLWAPDSSAILYLQSDESMVGEMHYVDFKPYLPNVIHQRHPKPGTANPRVRAGVVDVASAKTTWVDLGTYPHEYLANMQWLPDSARVAVQTLNRDQTKLDIFIADAATGEARHLLRETNEGWINVHDDLHFIDDGFIWLSERSGYAHLYRYDMDGELLNAVTAGDWAVKSSGGPAGYDMAVQHISDGWLWFTALEKHSTERHLYRVRLDGSGMARLSETDGVHSISFSPRGGYYVDRSASLTTPPSIAVHRDSGERTAMLMAPNTAFAERFDLLPWELFSVEARDGFEMPAMMLKPRFFDPEKKYPVVVYVYAGPSAPTVVNTWQSRARGYFHQVLANNGVIVFQVDNRSAAGKSKTDANTILKDLYGKVELNDLLDGIEWLKSQPYVDGERVGIWGWSGGGTMTMSAMTGSREFAAGVAVAGVTDWRFYDTIYTERYMRRPQDNEEGYQATSLVSKAPNLHGRLFLVHGTYDDNVHPQNAWAFTDALVGAGIPFDQMIYPMRKHGISDRAAQLHLYNAMLEFWKRELDLGD